MKQCLRTDGAVEITKGVRTVPEIEVADKESCRKQRLPKSGHLSRIQKGRVGHYTEEQDREESREKAAHSSFIERDERKLTVEQILGQDRCDEIPGDDIENVNADESASEGRKSSVKEKHRKHRNGPKAVDVGTILGRTAGD